MCSGCGFPCGGDCGCEGPPEGLTTMTVTYKCSCGNISTIPNETVGTVGRSWYAERECEECQDLMTAEGVVEEDIDDQDYDF